MRTQKFDLPDGTHTVVEWFGDEKTPEKGLIALLPALGVDVGFYRNLTQS